MPNYEVEHICPLTEGQKDEIASAITDIHAQQFTAPKLFVNVRFTNIKEHTVYVAGKRVRLALHSVSRSAICVTSLPDDEGMSSDILTVITDNF